MIKDVIVPLEVPEVSLALNFKEAVIRECELERRTLRYLHDEAKRLQLENTLRITAAPVLPEERLVLVEESAVGLKRLQRRRIQEDTARNILELRVLHTLAL